MAVVNETVTLWRPAGPEELALVGASGWREWPPQLPGQPIFYPVRDGFGAAGVFNPAATRQELSKLAAPVLVYAGELDISPVPDTAAAAARLFPGATVTVQPGAAHFPWLDDRALFTAAITSFLG